MENTAPLNRCLSNSAECNNYSFRMIQIISNHSKSIWPKTGMVIKTAQVTELPSPPGEVDSSWSSSLPPGSPWLQLCHSTKTHVGGLRSRVASDAWTAWRMDGTMEDHGRWLKDLDVDFTCWKSPANSWLENLWRSLKVWTWIVFCFQTFQALLSEILEVRPVIYTFVLGCGQHSLKQYRVALRKACHEGLREAGLSEDRHASDGAIGKFKSIDDKDCGNPWGFQRCFPIV